MLFTPHSAVASSFLCALRDEPYDRCSPLLVPPPAPRFRSHCDKFCCSAAPPGCRLPTRSVLPAHDALGERNLGDNVGQGQAPARLQEPRHFLEDPRLSAARSMTPFEMTQSNDAPGRPVSSIYPFR